MIYMHSAFESKAFPNWPGETKGTTSYLYSMSKTAPGTVQGTLDLRKDLQGHIKRSKHVIMAYWQSRSVPRKKLMATCALRFSPGRFTAPQPPVENGDVSQTRMFRLQSQGIFY